MKTSDLSAIMAAIYFSPHVNIWVGAGLGLMFFIGQIYFATKGN